MSVKDPNLKIVQDIKYYSVCQQTRQDNWGGFMKIKLV